MRCFERSGEPFQGVFLRFRTTPSFWGSASAAFFLRSTSARPTRFDARGGLAAPAGSAVTGCGADGMERAEAGHDAAAAFRTCGPRPGTTADINERGNVPVSFAACPSNDGLASGGNSGSYLNSGHSPKSAGWSAIGLLFASTGRSGSPSRVPYLRNRIQPGTAAPANEAVGQPSRRSLDALRQPPKGD